MLTEKMLRFLATPFAPPSGDNEEEARFDDADDDDGEFGEEEESEEAVVETASRTCSCTCNSFLTIDEKSGRSSGLDFQQERTRSSKVV